MKKVHKPSKIRRNLRARSKLLGTVESPRVCVFRSNKHIYVQAINDLNGTVIASATDIKLPIIKNAGKISRSISISKDLAGKLQKLKITKAVFDRNGYRYHGRVKAIAEELRNNGISL